MLHYRTNDTILLAACKNNDCTDVYKLLNPVTIGSVTTYDTICATNMVDQGQVIGSLGTSFGTTTTGAVPSHLHLQRFRDLNGGYSKDNLIDPLEEVRHQGPDFEVKILKNQGTAPNFMEGVNLSYPGSSSTSFLVRPIMPDIDQNGNPNSGYGANFIFFNNTMNVDQVELYLGKTSAPAFDLIKGLEFESKIWLGGRYQHHTHYPSESNTNVHEHEGSWTRQTVKPYCYSNRRGNFDDYYFSDFVTRIHTNDPMDGNTTPTMFADCPDDARYPDGRYKLYAEVTDVRNATFNSDTVNFELDNWKPYVKGVDISTVGGGQNFYAESWECQGNTIQFSNNGNTTMLNSASFLAGIRIEVTLSEPVPDLILNIPAYGIYSVYCERKRRNNTL